MRSIGWLEVDAPTRPTAAARRAQLFVAIFAGTALLLRLGLTIFDPGPGQDPDLLVRLERFVSYFTIQSNFAIFAMAIAVLRVPDLGTPWLRSMRLASLFGITVTSIVYVVVLSGDIDNSGLAQLANWMLHYVGPPLAVGLWLAFGPWPPMTVADIPRAMIWPALWIVYTLIHGAITDWYPYPFIDVVIKGYTTVAVNIAAITLFALFLALLYVNLNRWRRGFMRTD